jgi:Uma2 family endonuclease
MAHTLSTECDTAFRISLDVRSIQLTEEQFYLLCRDNRDLRLELSAEGELIIMPPTYTDTGWRCSRITRRVDEWAEKDGTGTSYGSSTGFTLPNGAKRSPDASWISHRRWQNLKPEDRKKMARICPDFVVELRSVTDRLSDVMKKMTEYTQNGARLGWLLDTIDKRVYIYRPRRPVECLENPDFLSGEDVLPGFRFNFQEILSKAL